jgi:hypothetical protein
MEGFHAKLGNRGAGDGFNEVPVVLDEKKARFTVLFARPAKS